MTDNSEEKQSVVAPTEKLSRLPDNAAEERRRLQAQVDELQRDREVSKRVWTLVFRIGGTIGALITFLIMLLSFVIDQLDKIK